MLASGRASQNYYHYYVMTQIPPFSELSAWLVIITFFPVLRIRISLDADPDLGFLSYCESGFWIPDSEKVFMAKK